MSPSRKVKRVNEEFLTSRSNIPMAHGCSAPTTRSNPHPRILLSHREHAFKGKIRKRCTAPLGPAKRALILSIVGVSGSEVRVPPAAIYGTARAVNSNGLSHRYRCRSLSTHLRPPPRNAP
ncbi:hypothetical protein ACJJTC_011862 [Scirpophaga incertulas]